MALDSLLNIFKPRDRVFFYHFEASAANVLKMSEDLIAIMKTEPGSQRTALLERLEIAEHANDDLTHTIFTDLARNFITPIDREDIHYLATSLDDVADYILASAKNLELFGLAKPDETCRELARLVNEGSKIVQMAVQGLRTMAKTGMNNEFVVRINSMENEADEVYDKSHPTVVRYGEGSDQPHSHAWHLHHARTRYRQVRGCGECDRVHHAEVRVRE
jgi:predicted phosphate transport protein (TIGR00153 family)